MTVKLNHTIVYCQDKRVSATFVAGLLGLGEPAPYGPFLAVQVDNEITLDFYETDEHIAPQHYAFLVGDTDFDRIFERIRDRKLPFWADPSHRHAGQINTHDGGRGLYFEDPNGHSLEIITRPYGSGD